MKYLVIERFKGGDPGLVYRRLEERGRLVPAGLKYVDSWVSDDLAICFQIMESDQPALMDQWMQQWADLVEFEVYPVITSEEARRQVQERS